MLQAAVCDNTLGEGCFGPAEVDVGSEIVDALVIAGVVILLDEGFDRGTSALIYRCVPCSWCR